MRIVPNKDGCEINFTLYRRPGISDDEYEADAAIIKKDLEKLKSVL